MAKKESAATPEEKFMASVWLAIKNAGMKQGLSPEDLHFLGTDEARSLAEPIGEAVAKIVSEARNAAKLFNPHMFFITRQGLYVWDDFVEKILSVASPTEPVSETKLAVFNLPHDMTDAEIHTELAEGYVFEDASKFCFMLAGMIKKQWNAEKGALLTNGCANIFYVRGLNDEVFAVGIRWLLNSREWCVFAALPSNNQQFIGGRAFSATTAVG